MTMGILLGYELGTGEEVRLPAHHLVVTGITRLSGKTTTLEGLLARGSTTALVFLTKRGEVVLPEAPRVPPFFLQRSDWQYVSDLLEAAIREKMRIQRSTIIKVSEGTSTLREVYDNILTEQAKPTTRGFTEAMLTQLRAYLDIIMPKLEEAPLVSTLDLIPNVTQVMDLSDYDLEIQALIVRSVAEEIHQHRTDVTLVIPEAHKFIPQGLNTPPKRLLELLVREGGSLNNWLFLDSQDIAGVEKAVLKQCDVWLLGRQREINEAEHVVKQIPLPASSRPRAGDIMTLGVGQFFACFGNEVKKVYVLPAWATKDEGRRVAMGDGRVSDPRPATDPPEEDDEMYKERAEAAEAALARERLRVKEMEKENQDLHAAAVNRSNRTEDQMKRMRTLDEQVRESTAENERLEIQVGELHKLNKERLEKTVHLEKRVELLTEEIEVSTSSDKNDKADLQAMDEIKDGLLHLFGSPNVGMGPSLDEDALEARIVEEVLQRIPERSNGQIVRLAPVPALGELFKGNVRQEMLGAAERLLSQVRDMTSRQQRSLAVLAEADGAPLTIVEIARRLGSDIRGSGGSHGAWSKDVNSLIADGFAEGDPGKRGFRSALEAKVLAALKYWEPTEEDLSAVRDNVLALVVKSLTPNAVASENQENEDRTL